MLAMVVTGAGLTALGWVTTQYLQSVVGLTPVAAAVTFAPMGLALAAGCMLPPLATRRRSPAVVIAAGLAVSTIGFLPAVFVHGTIALVLTDSSVAFGTGPLFALGTGLVVGSVPAERAGSAAALAEDGNHLGGTVGITVFGTLAAAVYQARLHDAPHEARESVAGATATARALPPPDAAHQLLDAAHGAFGSAITVIAVAGLAVFAALTLVCRRAASR